MSKYIPAVRIYDNHFSTHETRYEVQTLGSAATDDYQEALVAATWLAQSRSKQEDANHANLYYHHKKSTFTPVVLKEARMVETTDDE